MNTRPIPSTQEALPVIGCSTWIGFDVASGSAEYQRLPGVVKALFAGGGTMIDSSPMYGRAEAVTGELLAASKHRAGAFLTTKIWTHGREAGIAQMEESFKRLRTKRIDLIQVHNLIDWRTHLQTLRDWQEAGRVRYIGITHYRTKSYDEVEAALRAEKLDFLQINYSLDAQEAAQRLLPLAAERGVAVIADLPLSGGRLMRKLHGRPLPPWAAEIGCTSWAQVLLKFVLSHPAVTCTVPGTSNSQYMADNAAAGTGVLPGADFWKRHEASLAV